MDSPVHITVYCPRCRSKYQLDPAMRGQRMRCPNTVCREVFEVREEDQASPSQSTFPVREEHPDRAIEPPASAYGAGRVGEDIPLVPIEEDKLFLPELEENPDPGVIPVLPAEMAAGASVERSWHEPPPVRRPGGPADNGPSPPETPPRTDRPSRSSRGTARRPRPDGVPVSGTTGVPAEEVASEPAGGVQVVEANWAPPLVRRPTGAAPEEEVRQRRRVSSLAAALMVLLGLGVIAGGAWFAVSQLTATEEKQLALARADYEDGKFASAAQRYRQLEKAFPKSESVPLYRFFAQLSEVRNDTTSLVDPNDAQERLEGFVQAHQGNLLLKEYTVDLWNAAHKLLEGLTAKAREAKSRPLLDKARKLLALADQFKPSDVADTRRVEAQQSIDEVAALIQRDDERKDLLAEAIKTEATVEDLQELRRKIVVAGFEQDPEFKQVLAQKEKELRSRVTYVAETKPLRPPAEPFETCVLVTPLVQGPPTPPPPNGKVALALVRGVLYGLDQAGGRELWAMRVGIDTAALPVRLPATASSPEIFLVLSVLSAERNTLRGVDALSGESLWEHQLSAACQGRPVLVQRRAYVPTVAGQVEELEIIRGHRLGYFDLPGQRLTAGAVWQPDTDLLYVPGDAGNVYVLDVAKKACVSILTTGHPAGSLRAAPVLVNRPDLVRRDDSAFPPAYFILAQAEGLGAMRLRAFDLSPDRKDALAPPGPEPLVRGWSWFPAYQDGEKLAFVTDAGVLAIYGINQPRNVDQALFPELKEGYPLGSAGRPQRAQVVHAEENDFWVLANGQLQRLHFDRFAQTVKPVWDNPLDLGAPLHEGQVDDTGKVLFVVTRTEQQTCFATAVRADDGHILWRRQLGMECAAEPLVTPRGVVAVDQGGSVFAFDPAKHRDPAGAEWLLGGQLLAPPVVGGLRWTATAAGKDGSGVTVGVVGSGDQDVLIVRRFRATADKPRSAPTEERIPLTARLAGLPALGHDQVLLPLGGTEGSIYRVEWTGPAPRVRGAFNWRADRADESAVGHVVWISADEFLTTDGLRGLQRWRWRVGEDNWDEVSKKATLGARIVSAPLVLSDDRVCVADARGVLTLFQGPKLTTVARTWTLEGAITAGPFLRGEHVGCVVNGRRLVWIDLSQNAPVWDYSAAGEGIVGEPRLVGGNLLVADQAGRFVALDPATGRPRGPGYALKANVAPAAAPIPYGRTHALVPLTDGTLFLLPLWQVAAPVLDFPWVW